MLKTEAIKQFLLQNTEEDLANLYNFEMEVQVNVAQDNGKKIKGETKSGHKWWGYSDAQETWKNIRIPWQAKDNPHYEDSELNFSVKHFEGIGCTGWNWAQKKSIWVGFDFDSIVGHKKGLTDHDLMTIQEAVKNCDWVTMRRSTSGAGLHIYIFFKDPPSTENHDEHAALARSILGWLSISVGHKLESKVDTCGGILWFWHRRKKELGFKLIKQGKPLESFPQNWKEHVSVIQRRQPRIKFYGDTSVDAIMMKTRFIPLSENHKKLLGWFELQKIMWWWDPDRYLVCCHTFDLKRAHRELNLSGIFDTLATGKESGNDQNCFMYPMGSGWCVRRHHKGTAEHPTWEVDSSGWTRCYFDRPACLGAAARNFGGSETADQSFMFRSFDKALECINCMGISIEAPPELSGRPTTLVEQNDGSITIYVEKNKGDMWVNGWAPEAKNWTKTIKHHGFIKEIETPDENIRHLVSSGEDAGWYFRAKEDWIFEKEGNIRLALHALGNKKQDIPLLLGHCIINYWTLSCTPFYPEYPGNRVWNKNAPQFSVIPKPGNHETWDKVIEHIGEGLDEVIADNSWCKKNSITNGEDYLKLWVAAMFQQPAEPLPYLFLFGPQNAGKSIFHEALALLFHNRIGVVRGDIALINPSRFNAELHGAVLCIIEELHFKKQKDALERIKDLVTSKTVLIHPKGGTPYEIPNTTHWVHCSNSITAIPVFPGDTRIVVIKVKEVKEEIPKPKLLEKLLEEAPYFLDAMLKLEIPESNSRLRVPVISTYEKREQEEINRDPVSLFMMTLTHKDGYAETIDDLFQKFLAYLPEDQRKMESWTARRFTSEIPDCYERGRYKKGGYFHVANVSLQKIEDCIVPLEKLVKRGERLVTITEAQKIDLEKVIGKNGD